MFLKILFAGLLIISLSGEIICQNKESKKESKRDSLISKDRHPQDSPENSGIFVESKDKKTKVRFYGSVRLFGSMDFNGLQGGTGFSISDIPVGDESNNEKTFYMTANITRIGMETGHITKFGTVKMKIETDFNGGNGSQYRIRQAYIQTKYLIAGQTWTGFSDIETLPITVDIDGPPTAVSLRTVQIKYYLDFKPGWRFRASIESPGTSVFIPDTISVDEVTQNYPAVAVNIKKDWKAVSLKLAALINPISVRNLDGERESLFGGGALLSGNFVIAKDINFVFQGLLGKGIASFMKVSENNAFDVIFNPTDNQYQLTRCYGGFVALNKTIGHSRFDINFVYGMVNFKMEDYFAGNTFKFGQYIALNTFFSTFEGLKLGVEYTYGYSENKNEQTGNANRFAFTMYYDF